jgi:hypothetical protein
MSASEARGRRAGASGQGISAGDSPPAQGMNPIPQNLQAHTIWTLNNALNTLVPEEVGLMTFHENSIKVILKSKGELVFEFKDRDEMSKAIAQWADRSHAAAKLSSEATLRFLDTINANPPSPSQSL